MWVGPVSTSLQWCDSPGFCDGRVGQQTPRVVSQSSTPRLRSDERPTSEGGTSSEGQHSSRVEAISDRTQRQMEEVLPAYYHTCLADLRWPGTLVTAPDLTARLLTPTPPARTAHAQWSRVTASLPVRSARAADL